MAKLSAKVNELCGIERGAKQLQNHNKLLERQLEQTLKQLEAARKSKIDIQRAVGKQSAKRGKADVFCRVLIPDTHGASVHIPTIKAVLADIALIQPREVIMLGDHLECGGFLAQHHTLGYVAQTEYTFEDDVAACNQLLDQLQLAAPNATKEYLFGNHEARLEKWIVDATLGNPKDAAMLRRSIGVEHVLFLDKRNIPFYEPNKFYDGLRVPGTIKRQNCHFTHGVYINENAAMRHVRKYGGNVVFGHIHRSQSAIIRTVSAGEIGGWCPGCICNLQPMWQHTNCTDWSHGYGLQLVQGERFLHINIPVLEGMSMIGPLAKQLRLG